MNKEIPFSQFTRELNVRSNTLSYSDLTNSTEHGAEREGLNNIKVGAKRFTDFLSPICPWDNGTSKTVLPLAAYLALFQLFILRVNVQDVGIISAGLVAVIIGLMIFMEGLKFGLMPFGESLGTSLPAKATLAVVLTVVSFGNRSNIR